MYFNVYADNPFLDYIVLLNTIDCGARMRLFIELFCIVIKCIPHNMYPIPLCF